LSDRSTRRTLSVEQSLKRGKRMMRSWVAAGRMVAAPPGRDEPAFDVFLRLSALTLAVIGAAGGVWGLVRGLAYPPTVWFAVLEGGLIFVVLGAVPAVLVGLGAVLWQRLRRRR
jgi:hypothetical protein